MVAVGCVIWNRHIKWGETLEGVILGKNQFTSMANGPRDIPENDPVADDARSIANQILAGTVSDITNGALYYANLAIADSPWFEDHIVKDTVNHPLSAKILHHTFFL